MYENWLLDVTFYSPDMPRCFVPIEGDSVIVGLTVITDLPNGKLVGVFHSDGQEAVEAWMDSHEDELAELAKEIAARDDRPRFARQPETDSETSTETGT